MAGIAVLLCFLMLAGCSSMNEAENKVSKELKALQSSGSTGSEVIALRDSLSDEGRENFDGFLKKLRSFEFEITGSEEDDDKDDDYTLVSVRIKTFDFGREYLAAWTEYLKANEDTTQEDRPNIAYILPGALRPFAAVGESGIVASSICLSAGLNDLLLRALDPPGRPGQLCQLSLLVCRYALRRSPGLC